MKKCQKRQADFDEPFRFLKFRIFLGHFLTFLRMGQFSDIFQQERRVDEIFSIFSAAALFILRPFIKFYMMPFTPRFNVK